VTDRLVAAEDARPRRPNTSGEDHVLASTEHRIGTGHFSGHLRGAASFAGSTSLADGFCFGRGPCWFEGLLWFSDALREEVHTVDMHGTTTSLAVSGHAPYGLGFRPDGSLLIVSSESRQVLCYDGESVSTLVDLSGVVTADLGEIVVDELGRAYVGSQARERGLIVRIDPDQAVTVVARDLDFPSGMVIDPRTRTLTVAESVGRRLTTFDVHHDGALSGRRPFAERLDGPPDGIALDADGGIWAALTLAHRFQRVLPGGAVTHCIDIADRMAIACALGGPDRRFLFLLSNSSVYSQLLAGSKSTRVDVINVDVPAPGLAPYQGEIQ